MSGQEFIIAIVGITTGTALVGYTVAKVTGLIQKWMDQRHDRKTGGAEMQQLVEEYQQFKSNTQRRLQNLEAIVSEGEPEQLEEPTMDMTQEIEFPEEEQHAPASSQQQDSSGDNRLNNMLD
ncbi:MAG: hypothetical protein ACQETE_06785 [Bacteroidota bacterium]